jgi:hemerythrin
MSQTIDSINPKYRLGIDEMDIQHARWIRLIEEFRSVAEGKLLEPAGIDAAESALVQLREYTASHFASEEQFMSTRGYPGLEAHKLRHRELEALVRALLEDLRSHKGSRAPLKLNLLVTIWLLEHILQEDGKYARFVAGRTQ